MNIFNHFFRFNFLFAGVMYGLFVLSFFFPGTVSSSEDRTTAGQEVYNKNCWFCHGQEGNGNSDAAAVLKPKPKDFTDPDVIAELSFSRIITSITKGRPGTAMPSFKGTISEQEIQSVALYIKEVIMKKAVTVKAYQPHAEEFSSLQFDLINEKSDITICLLHCHSDEQFIRRRLREQQ